MEKLKVSLKKILKIFFELSLIFSFLKCLIVYHGMLHCTSQPRLKRRVGIFGQRRPFRRGRKSCRHTHRLSWCSGATCHFGHTSSIGWGLQLFNLLAPSIYNLRKQNETRRLAGYPVSATNSNLRVYLRGRLCLSFRFKFSGYSRVGQAS